LLASANATIQADLAVHFGGNYGLALALVAGSVAVIIAVLTSLGVEAKGIAFGRSPRAALEPENGSAIMQRLGPLTINALAAAPL
jgi:SHS family lactate transporter-like MFS transporter